MTKEYRGPYKANPKYLLKRSDDLARQVIACIYELQEEAPKWEQMEKYLNGRTYNSKTGLFDWWNELINGRRAVFHRIEDNRRIIDQLWRAAHKRQLRIVTKVAYPSSALEQEVIKILPKAKQCRFYDLLLKGILDPKHDGYTIYIVSEQKSVSGPKSPIYVGQTRQLLERRWVGHKNADYKGFVDYARYRHEDSADWSVHYLSFEECRSFAIEGQLTPDLKNNQEAQQLLDEKYSKYPEWGLDQAETALITYYRPHFNKSLNLYPSLLQYTDYCQKRCPVCNPTPNE